MNSDNVKKGPERAPNRSLFYALGYTPEELAEGEVAEADEAVASELPRQGLWVDVEV